MNISSVCVFCGSNAGLQPEYAEKAREVGNFFAENNIHLIFGGGKVGIMGIIADAVLEKGGKVTGIIPGFLSRKEVEHAGVSEMIRVGSMHERKAIMYDRSDAFMTLPGGTGTMDEFFEILTWSQLGLHAKPIGIFNIRNYFDPVIAQLDKMTEEKFLHPDNRKLVVEDSSLSSLWTKMKEFRSPGTEKWLERSKI